MALRPVKLDHSQDARSAGLRKLGKENERASGHGESRHPARIHVERQVGRAVTSKCVAWNKAAGNRVSETAIRHGSKSVIQKECLNVAAWIGCLARNIQNHG